MKSIKIENEKRKENFQFITINAILTNDPSQNDDLRHKFK